jgi:hypothetical protein
LAARRKTSRPILPNPLIAIFLTIKESSQKNKNIEFEWKCKEKIPN